jgi:hypothetical protein
MDDNKSIKCEVDNKYVYEFFRWRTNMQRIRSDSGPGGSGLVAL